MKKLCFSCGLFALALWGLMIQFLSLMFKWMGLMTVLLLMGAASLCGENFFPNGSFEGNWRPAWNRMAGESYLAGTPGWSLKKEGSSQFLESDGSGTPLELQFEGPARDLRITFSMMSGKPGTPVTAEFFSYSYLNPLPLGKKVFTPGAKWGDFSFISARDNRMRMHNMAPLKLKITPPKGVTLRVDNVRCEKKFPPLPNKVVKRVPAPETPGAAVPINEKIPFTVGQTKAALNVPFTVALPFGAGQFKCPGTWAGVRVRDAAGKVWPAQARVIARWPRDNSVRALAVDTAADLKAGRNTFTAEPGKAPEKGNWAPRQTLYLSATDGQGNVYTGSSTPETSEIDGPLRKVFSGWTSLKAPGKPEIPVQCRTGFFRGVPDVEIEVSLHNPYANVPFILGSAEVTIRTGKQGKAEKKSVVTSPGAKPLTPGSLCVSSAGGVLIMPQAAERHPAALETTPDGTFKAALWPKELKQLCLSHNLVLTRRFIWSPDPRAADRFGGEAPTALAEPARFGQTRFFLLPLGTVDRKNYPYAAACIDDSFQFRYTKAGQMKSGQNGLFNYGDLPGDGGWSNLESFEDYAEILRAVVYDDPGKLAFAFDRAVHYRDIDTFRGVCHYHMSNHVAGGTSYSHSWPQGIVCHYLLTGDPRSRAVLEELSDADLAVPVNYRDISEARALSRYLLGLADLYGVLGRPALRERFYAQVRHAEKTNLTPKRNDDTIFPWGSRLDPYQVWYGACAFMEMYFLTGDKALLDSFHREMKASLNMEFFALDLKESWPGVPPEKGWPIQLGFHSRHRGSLIYPLLVFQSRIDNDPGLLKLAQRAAYADWCAGRLNGGDATTFFRLSGQEGKTPEKQLIAEARKLVFDAASPKLLNGDFSLSPKWFVHWHLPDLRQMGFDSAVDEWPLQRHKDFKKINQERMEKFSAKVSPWRYYSRLFGFLDTEEFGAKPPALGVQLSSRWVLGRMAAVGGAYVRMDPGKWRWRASYKTDAASGPQCFARMRFFFPGEMMQFMTVNLAKTGPVPVIDNGQAKNRARDFTARITPGPKPGWKTLEMVFTVPKPGVAMPMFYLYLAPGHTDTFIRLDDISLEKI